MRTITAANADMAAQQAAAWARAHLAVGIERHGRASLALSGGTSPIPLFVALARTDLDWTRVDVFQVDERWVSATSADRNWAAIKRHLVGPTGARPRPLTVGGGIARPAARELIVASDSATLRRALGASMEFDVIHLGVGADGHTASWPPGEQLDGLLATPSPLATVWDFNGFDRTTLTPAVINRARHLLWFVTGDGKRPILSRLLDGDSRIPAAFVEGADQRLFTDFDVSQ